jgi:hypothetical protein
VGDLPRTGADARRLGKIYYYTGVRCVRGHDAPRYAMSNTCAMCSLEWSKQRHKAAVAVKAAARAGGTEA